MKRKGSQKEVKPVGHECVVLSPEHNANIACVLLGRIKVSVVSNLCGDVHHSILLHQQRLVPQGLVVTQSGLRNRQKGRNNTPGLLPGRAAECHEAVQSRLRGKQTRLEQEDER